MKVAKRILPAEQAFIDEADKYLAEHENNLDIDIRSNGILILAYFLNKTKVEEKALSTEEFRRVRGMVYLILSELANKQENKK